MKEFKGSGFPYCGYWENKEGRRETGDRRREEGKRKTGKRKTGDGRKGK